MLLASVIGGYTLIGGLGATFYVSYFNTALIFILIIMLVAEVLFQIMQRFAGWTKNTCLKMSLLIVNTSVMI